MQCTSPMLQANAVHNLALLSAVYGHICKDINTVQIYHYNNVNLTFVRDSGDQSLALLHIGL
jgi:hypothetical protein